MPTEKKKKELTFKLDYFDLIKGVLFPNRGKPAPKKAAIASSLEVNPVPTAVTAKPAATKPAARPFFQAGKLLPAFWTTASVLSFIVNVILIVVLVVVGQQLFTLKQLVNDHLLGGLYENFILMDRAHIKTNITVEDNIAINFDLPISQETTVTLTQDTRITGAYVGVLSAPTTVTLPAGTTLPIRLEMTVPVSTTIPIKLNVPVDIPLEQTELHQPFVGLQKVVSPFYWMLQPQIKTSGDVPACQGQAGWFCRGFFK
jgi:hypothetical protein